jgi:hypothetical protein
MLLLRRQYNWSCSSSEEELLNGSSCPRHGGSVTARTGRRDGLCNCKDVECNCKAQHVSAFLSSYIEGKEGTRLRREVKKPSVTSHQKLRMGPKKGLKTGHESGGAGDVRAGRIYQEVSPGGSSVSGRLAASEVDVNVLLLST